MLFTPVQLCSTLCPHMVNITICFLAILLAKCYACQLYNVLSCAQVVCVLASLSNFQLFKHHV